MEVATVVDLGRSALWAIVLISSPLLLVALGVGLFFGVIQAATSINEATLSFIPKLAAMGATLAIFGSWQLVMLVDYTKDIYKRIPALFS
ncbi:MAG: Flagellar biosynthetic protein FliQ [Pseudomonadota bacterium]